MIHREVEYAHNTSYILHNDVLPPPVVSLPLSRQRNWSIRSVTLFAIFAYVTCHSVRIIRYVKLFGFL